MKSNLKILLALTFILATVTMGCDVLQSDDELPPGVQVQMQVQTQNSMSKQFSASNEESTIEIREVKMFVEEFELDGTHGTKDFEVEYFIVNLPLDGSPLILTEKEIPAGIYDEFELEIEKPDDDVHVDDRDFRDETGSYSLVIKGVYNGEEFTFRSTEDFEIEIDLFPPLVVEVSGTSVLVISVDISSWFIGKDGEVLDPKDFRNTEQINKNIERSFEAWEDYKDDKYKEYEFDDMPVQSVDTSADSFTLIDGRTFYLASFTEFDGDFKTLEQVADALDKGIRVEAEGEYFISSEGLNIVIEVEFEKDDD